MKRIDALALLTSISSSGVIVVPLRMLSSFSDKSDFAEALGGTGGKYSPLGRGWFALGVPGIDVDEPVRLKSPLGVLVGNRAASPETLPRTGL
jgi:hypothetical protein